MTMTNALNKVEDLVDKVKEYDIRDLRELENLKDLRKLLQKNEEIKEKEKNNTLIWILAIIGIVVVCAAVGFAIYKFLVPDYLEDFDDDLDDFDDDFFEDDDLTNWADADEAELKKDAADAAESHAD